MVTVGDEVMGQAQYEDGQLLRARDLEDDIRTESHLWAWHVAGLHNTWGIALGLAVEQSGPSQVRVAPGLAYDCRGRELLLAEEKLVPLPLGVNSTELDLVIAVAETPVDAGAKQTLAAVCLEDLSSASKEGLQFIWRKRNEVRLGLDIPLAWVTRKGGGLVLDLGVRYYARSLAQPHVVAGHTPAGASWTPWSVLGKQLGWAIRVDTAEAGFARLPHYSASLTGDPFHNLTQPGLKKLLILLTFVTDATVDSFWFVALLAVSNQTNLSKAAEIGDSIFLRSAPSVAWLGVEPVATCGLMQPLFIVRMLQPGIGTSVLGGKSGP